MSAASAIRHGCHGYHMTITPTHSEGEPLPEEAIVEDFPRLL